MDKRIMWAVGLMVAVLLVSQTNGFSVSGAGDATAVGTITAKDGFGYVPIGTILPFYKIKSPATTALTNSDLPTGWVLCDGSSVDVNLYPAAELLDGIPADGFKTPNLNNLNSASLNPAWPNTVNAFRGVFLRGGTYAGKWEDDQFQGHVHQTNIVAGSSAHGNIGTGGGVVTPNGRIDNPKSTDPIADTNANGNPRTGKETRPLNMSVVYIMRVK